MKIEELIRKAQRITGSKEEWVDSNGAESQLNRLNDVEKARSLIMVYATSYVVLEVSTIRSYWADGIKGELDGINYPYLIHGGDESLDINQDLGGVINFALKKLNPTENEEVQLRMNLKKVAARDVLYEQNVGVY